MAEEWVGWLTLIIVVVVLVIIVGLIVYFKVINNGQNPINRDNAIAQRQQYVEKQLQLTRPVIQWGPDQAGPTPLRNTCQLYTFPAVMEGDFAIQGQPTFRSSVIESLPPLGPPSGCVDIDQMALQQFQRACLQPTCTDSFGQTYQQGDVSTYYQVCGTGSSACNDILGLIAFNFSSNTSTNECLTANTDLNGPALVGSCSLANSAQLFRVTRYQPSGQVDNSAGPYASILNRNSGLYLAPVSGTAGSLVTLQNASNLPNKGVIWWLFSYFAYQVNGQNIVVPPQLVYWTNITATPPNSQQNMENFLRSNGPNMLVAVYNSQGQVVLQPMLLNYDSSNPEQQIYNTQLLSYDIYNLLLTSDNVAKSW